MCDTLIIDFSDDVFEPTVIERTYDTIDYEILKAQDYMYKKLEEENFISYTEWYSNNIEGTIEHPYINFDEDGEVLTGYSYYRHEKNSMVEIKLLFDKDLLDTVKTFISEIGFTFDKSVINSIERTMYRGSIHNPIFVEKFGEEFRAINLQNVFKSNMSEIRLVFDSTQLDTTQNMLKIAGFVF